MGSMIALRLNGSLNNPRNSEGSFVTLADGRIMYAYSRYYGESTADDGAATICARYSADGGQTWSSHDRLVVSNEGTCNVMSASLLRLRDGRIALVYLRKNSISDCRPYIRISSDEGETWGEPVLCISSTGFFVVNNDRLVQLDSGRLVLPAAYHRTRSDDSAPSGEGHDDRGIALFYWSDDSGATWHESVDWWALPVRDEFGLQEPGVVELTTGELYGWCRTGTGFQWQTVSGDGETWSPPERSQFRSPCSPLSMKRIPASGDLLAVWNDHSGHWDLPKSERVDASRARTPLVLATSADDGKTWRNARLIETDPDRGFCYTAIHFVNDAILLAYSCGRGSGWGLPDSCIRRITLDRIYT